MTRRPWVAERLVDIAEATSLIESQFRELSPALLTPLGEGWDNTAYLVNDTWVFRFPRREIAVSLIETEAAVLPQVAPQLPLAVPVPKWRGQATDGYPWPFAGYRCLPGRLASEVGLDARSRVGLAAPLGGFLRALHGLNVNDLDIPGDVIRRMDLPMRTDRARARLEQLVDTGFVNDPGPIEALLDETPHDWTPGTSTLVHGDLDCRHVLVRDNDVTQPTGIIDWGDLHLGDPAVDLNIAYTLLPADARLAFFDAYGDVTDTNRHVARLRALHVSITIAAWAVDTGNVALQREVGEWLRNCLAE